MAEKNIVPNLRSKSIEQESNIHPETMAGEVPAVY